MGETTLRHAGVRVIAATNRDLAAELGTGRFRPGLFYRFARPLTVPPLRDRLADLDAYVAHWCATMTGAREPSLVMPAALDRLRAHRWPGNLWELRFVLECARAIAVARTIERHAVECTA